MAGTIQVNDRTVDWRAGMTITDVLKACDYVFPMLVVNLNGRLVKKANYDKTEVPDGAEVKVVHLVSGG